MRWGVGREGHRLAGQGGDETAIQVVDGTLGRALSVSESAQVSGTLGQNDSIQFNLPSGSQTISLTGGAL